MWNSGFGEAGADRQLFRHFLELSFVWRWRGREIGKVTVLTPLGHKIAMYDQERTICDLVRSRSRFEIQDFQTALKSYVAKKDKNLNILMEYAKLFHVDGIIREYMGVML